MSRISNLGGAVAIPDFLPSGVYFLCFEKEVVYVGQSVNVFARVATHRRSARIAFDFVFYISVPVEDLDRIEKEFIEELDPECNQTGVCERDGGFECMSIEEQEAEIEDLVEFEAEHGEARAEELLGDLADW